MIFSPPTQGDSLRGFAPLAAYEGRVIFIGQYRADTVPLFSFPFEYVYSFGHRSFPTTDAAGATRVCCVCHIFPQKQNRLANVDLRRTAGLLAFEGFERYN